MQSERWRVIFREALNILITLELILIYFCTLDLFQPSYIMLYRGTTWDRDYKIGLVESNFYMLLLLFSIGLCIGKYTCSKNYSLDPIKLAVYVLVALTAIDCLPLLYWTICMWNPQLSYASTHWKILPDLDTGLFHVYAPAYPLLLLVTFYAWTLLFINRVVKGQIKLRFKYNKTLNGVCSNKLNNTFMGKLGLILIILLSILLPIIPYIPTMNPDFKPVSVDIKYYATFLNDMLARDAWSAVGYAFHDGRAFYRIILYGLAISGIPKELVLNLEAPLIAPFFALAVYFTGKKLSGNNLYAFLCALAGILGFSMTVNMYGGFFAAWLAITLFYVCIALTPSVGEGNLKSLVGCTIASIFILYTHPWTWSILMAVLSVYLVASTIGSLKSLGLKLNRQILTLLITNATVDLFKTLTTPRYGGAESSISTLNCYLKFDNMLKMTWNLQRLTTTYLGGLLFNPLHMLLAFIGILNLLKSRKEKHRLIIVWTSITSLILPLGDTALQSRLLLSAPFPILIAEGLWVLSKFLARFDSRLPKLFQVFFIVSSLTYTVRALCNLI
ncbi:MAG: hypothetical protein QXO15_11080 [Nitrososphaerota archaeon]